MAPVRRGKAESVPMRLPAGGVVRRGWPAAENKAWSFQLPLTFYADALLRAGRRAGEEDTRLHERAHPTPTHTHTHTYTYTYTHAPYLMSLGRLLGCVGPVCPTGRLAAAASRRAPKTWAGCAQVDAVGQGVG